MIKKTVRAELRTRRHHRNRLVVRGTTKRPRLSVFRSEKHIYAQLIDDEKSLTLTSVSSLHKELTGKPKAAKGTKSKAPLPAKAEKMKEAKEPTKEAQPQESSRPLQMAKSVGQLVAQKALEKGITEVVFDRGGFKFHGRVKALADGAREAGLKF